MGLRRLLIGKPLHNDESAHERLPKWKALSIFSSDALSSVAYGPEQIMLALVAIPSVMAYGYMLPVAISILILLGIIALSYVQVAKANPNGGGAYAVAKKNLGEYPALFTAGSVFADYVLTAAVSVSAGTAAIVSAFPQLIGNEVVIDLFVLFVILMLVNLRGIRESSNAFVYPTYAFILGIFVLLGAGIYQALISGAPVIPPESLVKKQLDFSMFFLLLRAFANGCSSMTGIEAIADSVPLFNKPESKNAVTTTYWMVGILGLMFSGITFLMMHYHILPINEVTSLSQIAEIIFGRGWMYYYIQISTMLILYLAANTAYNGLPVLMSIIARDGYMPRYLSNRGERLTYSNGIILLTLAAAFLIVVYGGETEHLISLYAIGVFISFTIAQTGMIVHWKNEKSSGWQLKAIINGIGALTTGLIVLIIAVSKFTHGAWIIILFIPTAVYTFKKIKAHYTDVAEQLHLPIDQEQKFVTGRNIVVVPVSSLSRVVYDTVRYAKTISDHVILLHVAESEESAQKVREKFEDWQPHVDLITLQNPYRMLVKPVCDFVDEVLANKNPEDFVTVIVPEFEPNKWWQRFLHGQSGWILRTYLILMKDVVVSTIPFHLKK